MLTKMIHKYTTVPISQGSGEGVLHLCSCQSRLSFAVGIEEIKSYVFENSLLKS